MTATTLPRTQKYVIVSPVRDEEQHIELTIRSVLQQTVKPSEWIIVDDGSRDGTHSIVKSYSDRYPWIRALRRSDRGQRVPGTGVMEAFYRGYHALSDDWDFLVKLDGDVGLPADYFEQCLERMRQDPKLGMCGGVMFSMKGGVLAPERHPLVHVRGPIKLYRRACWDAIGGLIKSPGWDTVDEIQANRHGWKTRSFQELQVIHHRPTGAAQGAWRDSVKNGRADYVSGYHPVFMAAKCLRRVFLRPFAIMGVGQACGYLTGYLNRMPRVPDPALIHYLRSQQIRRLLHLNNIWR